MTRRRYLGGAVSKHRLDPDKDGMYSRRRTSTQVWVDLQGSSIDIAFLITNALVEEFGGEPVRRWSYDFLY